MKYILLKLYISGILTCLLTGLKAQDPQFSQFNNSSLYYNPATIGILFFNPLNAHNEGLLNDSKTINNADPATAGLSGNIRISSTYRNQWSAVQGDLSDFLISIDGLLLKKKSEHQVNNLNSGLGFIMLNNNEGFNHLKTQRFELIYSYRIKFGTSDICNNFSSRNMVQFGFSLSNNIRNMQKDGFIFPDQIDPVIGPINKQSAFVIKDLGSTNYWDFNVGILYRYSPHINQGFFMPTIGISASHISTPDISMIKGDASLPVKYILHSNVMIKSKKEIKLNYPHNNIYFSPGIIYEYQEPFQSFTIGSDSYLYPFIGGIWFRSKNYYPIDYGLNTIIFHLGYFKYFENNKHYLIVDYSLDFTVSKLGHGTWGAHEITLRYNISKVQDY